MDNVDYIKEDDVDGTILEKEEIESSGLEENEEQQEVID